MTRSLLQRAGVALSSVERLLLGSAAFAMIAIMAIVVADVVLRYAFNRPIPWAYPLISRYLMIYMFFLAVADTLRRNEHVFVDILTRSLSRRSRDILELLGLVPSVVVIALMTWLGVLLVRDQFLGSDVEMDALRWPSWVASMVLPVGLGAMLARAVLRIVALAARIVRPGTTMAAAYGEFGVEAHLGTATEDCVADPFVARGVS